MTAKGKRVVAMNANKPHSLRRQVAGLMTESKAAIRQLKATEEVARRRR